MPIILAIQEGEIRKMAVQSQHRQICHEILSWKYPTQERLAEWIKWYSAYLASVRP
jgi:hypothetical protein